MFGEPQDTAERKDKKKDTKDKQKKKKNKEDKNEDEDSGDKREDRKGKKKEKKQKKARRNEDEDSEDKNEDEDKRGDKKEKKKEKNKRKQAGTRDTQRSDDDDDFSVVTISKGKETGGLVVNPRPKRLAAEKVTMLSLRDTYNLATRQARKWFMRWMKVIKRRRTARMNRSKSARLSKPHLMPGNIDLCQLT